MKKKVFVVICATLVLIGWLTACEPKNEGAPIVDRTSISAQPAEVTTTTRQLLTDEERFVGLLDEYGVYYSSEESAVGLGKYVCEYRSMHSQDETISALILINDQAESEDSDDTYHHYSTEELAGLYQASTTIFCPQYTYQ